MTKKHQEFFWGNLEEAIGYFNQPKGEFTLVMEGAKQNEPL
jgi:16S rRNA C1402 (ribose-2'-O) methylase RsmI